MNAERFDVEAYWSSREKKTWVVHLHGPTRGRKRAQMDVKYVTAKTERGAIRTAKYFSSMKRISHASARLAHPVDLGCVPCDCTKHF